ncbi:MAG: hypothetical protein DMG34_12890 [Acidobacteria bacterium]|nr:MAG: hypothetical protein DMG34_12890 [Acidobacteriota bacterium]
MCPFCLANVAMLAAGVTSTGGLTAFVAGKLRAKSKTREISNNFKRRIKSRVHGRSSTVTLRKDFPADPGPQAAKIADSKGFHLGF